MISRIIYWKQIEDQSLDSNERDMNLNYFGFWVLGECRIITSELSIWSWGSHILSTPSRKEGPVLLVALQWTSQFAFYTVESELAFENDVKYKWLHSTLPLFSRILLPFVLSTCLPSIPYCSPWKCCLTLNSEGNGGIYVFAV